MLQPSFRQRTPLSIPDDRDAAAQAVVSTPAGTLVGARLLDAQGRATTHVFKGVPYAAPPVGPLRWRPPQPCAPWAGVRRALRFGADCPQPGADASRAGRRSEDCLSLNIWAPADAATGTRPVMVWLHGGSFVSGSGSDPRTDGACLAREGVVVVTLNYRVGLFGFFAHPALSAESAQGASGNYGLLDQLCALRWVRDNIAAFGGDPARVTLFGNSAGGAAVALLLASPLAEGLFQQAILQSPGTGRSLAPLRQAEAEGLVLGPDIEALRGLDADALLACTARLAPTRRSLTAARVTRPIVDGHVIVDDERAAWRAGRVRSLPVLIGGNVDEGSLLTAGWPVATLAAYRDMLASDFGRAAAAVEAMYSACTDAEVRARVGELCGDAQFNAGVRGLARTLAQQRAPTWRYLYTRRAPGRATGPHHTDEIGDVFGNLGHLGEEAGSDSQHAEFAARLRKAWVAFATHGNPNHPGLRAHWPMCGPSADRHLVLGERTFVDSGWRTEQLDLLDRLFDAATH